MIVFPLPRYSRYISAHVSSLIRFFASLILLSSINSHLVPPSPGTFWDFVELCGYCSTFQGICIAVGLVGGYENMISNKMERSGKKMYFLRLLFPTFEHMKRQYPVLKKAPLLLPLYWLVRLVTKPFVNRRANAEKLKLLVRK